MKKIGLVVAILFISYMMFMGDGVNDSVIDEYETKQERSSDKVSGENDTTTSTSTISGDELKVHFIDVGQGDSILVESPNNHFMLIDGGVKGSGDEVVDYLIEQGVGELDYVIATHPDADHIGGLISVLGAFKVNEFIDSGKVHTSQTFEQMISLVDQKNIPYTVPKVGDTVPLDDELVISVISADEHATDNNEASIVLKITHGEISYLLAADAGIEMENLMLRNENIKATVLKAGHHGSNTSSSQAFLQAVQPEVTILSYGQDNSYGHPHAEVVTGLQQVGSKIYGTAETGTIIVSSNGTSYEVNAAEWTGVGAPSSIKPAAKVDF